jgi:hypothetical protein
MPNTHFCFAYDPILADSTNYRNLKINLGYTTLQHLIPSDVIIQLQSNDKAPKDWKSFSINSYFQSEEKLKQQAKRLTDLSNNALYFNQRGYLGNYFKRNKRFTYYDNYKSDKKTQSDIILHAGLTETNGVYELRYIVKGKNVNLNFPNPIDLSITFDKTRFDSGDYSEAGRKINVLLKEIILMNTLF